MSQGPLCLRFQDMFTDEEHKTSIFAHLSSHAHENRLRQCRSDELRRHSTIMFLFANHAQAAQSAELASRCQAPWLGSIGFRCRMQVDGVWMRPWQTEVFDGPVGTH
jgi:hypothetical protein